MTLQGHVRHRCFVLALLLILCLVCSVASERSLAAQGPSGAAGKIIHIRGSVEIFAVDGQAWTKAAAGSFLAPGDTIRTGAAGWAAVLMADESLIQVARNSSLVLKEVQASAGWLKGKPVAPALSRAKRSVYKVKRGRIWLRNKSAKPRIGIETPTVTAAIRGTELGVEVEADNTVRLTVLEGLVGASPVGGNGDQGVVELKPGEQCLAKPGQPLRKLVLVNPERAVQWILTIPPLIGPRDMPLFSSDIRRLKAEAQRLEAVSGPDESQRVMLAGIYRDLGRNNEAGKLLQGLSEAGYTSPEAELVRGWVMLDLGRYDEALAAFGQAGNADPKVALGRAAALNAKGDPAGASTQIAAGLKAFPDSDELAIFRAWLELTNGALDRALPRLEKLTAEAPDNGLAWSLTALARITSGKEKQAVAAATKAARVRPGSPTTWLVLGLARQSVHDLPGALEATDKALALEPDNVPALINRARLRFAMDYIDIAWAAADKARRLAPDDAGVQSLLGFLELARRKHTAALTAFNRAAELNSGLADPRLGLALVHMRQGRAGAALESMTTAVLLQPRRSLYVSYWGKMLYQVKRFDQSLDVLAMAAALDDNDPTPHLYRSIILRDLNRPTEAIGEMNRAVAKNDNRAVYRSRFLLDQDLAVKNVALSILYDSLGLEAWAFNRATASIKQDYMNSAGHKFLAGALAGLEGRDRAADSEALMARLLEAPNQNSFNTFNEYTTFFEQPYIQGQISGEAGTQETYAGDLYANAALPRAGLAATVEATQGQTAGWRGSDNFQEARVAGRVKWQAGRDHSFLASARFDHVDQMDKFYPRYEYDNPADLFDKQEIDQTTVEAGYRWHIAPKADLLAVVTYSHADGWFYQRQREDYSSFSLEVLGKYFNTEPYVQGQAQLQFEFKGHQIITGTVQYTGDHKLTQVEKGYLIMDGERYFVGQRASQSDMSKRFQSYYIQDIWPVTDWLTIEAALYYDRIEATNAYFSSQWTTENWGPRLGLVIRPTNRDTIRLAGFSYLLPFVTSRIDPMDIAGVTLFRNHVEASVAQELDLIWERTWKGGFLSTNLFYVTRDYTYNVSPTSDFEVTEKGRMGGFEAAVNQLVCQGVGLTGRYRYSDVSDDGLPQADRRDHLASLAATWVHPSGLSANLTQSYRFTDRVADGYNDENIWLTDARIGYEFPGKRGRVDLIGRNLFDNRFNWVNDFFVRTGRAPAREILLALRLNF